MAIEYGRKGGNVARMEKTTYAYKILFWKPEVLIPPGTRRQGVQIEIHTKEKFWWFRRDMGRFQGYHFVNTVMNIRVSHNASRTIAKVSWIVPMGQLCILAMCKQDSTASSKVTTAVRLRITFFWDVTRCHTPEECNPQDNTALETFSFYAGVWDRYPTHVIQQTWRFHARHGVSLPMGAILRRIRGLTTGNIITKNWQNDRRQKKRETLGENVPQCYILYR
jgi:hypothetical protein